MLERWTGLDRCHPLKAGEQPQLAHAVEVWTHGRNLRYRVTFFGGQPVPGGLHPGIVLEWDHISRWLVG